MTATDAWRATHAPRDLYAEGLLAASNAALPAAVAGRHVTPGHGFLLRSEEGTVLSLDLPRFLSGLWPGDEGLLQRCSGPALDVGCGPGRLVAALGSRGTSVLGIDITPDAVRLARVRAGARLVLQRSVFDPLPGEGRWARVLLADGNIGIGGDPVLLLERVHDLLAPDGVALVETSLPGTGVQRRRVRIESPDGRASQWFDWAEADPVGMACLGGDLAADPELIPRGLEVVETWHEAGRWFVGLRRS